MIKRYGLATTLEILVVRDSFNQLGHLLCYYIIPKYDISPCHNK